MAKSRNRPKYKPWIRGVWLVLAMGTMVGAWGATFSSRDLSLGYGHVGTLSAGRDVYLNGTMVSGSVMAGRAVKGEHCQVRGYLRAGRDIILDQCGTVTEITAGRNLRLSDTTVSQKAVAGAMLELVNATVQGNAIAGGQARMINSQVADTLTAATPHLLLKASTVQNVRFHVPRFVHHTGSSVGAGVVINGSVNGSLVTAKPGSVAMVNGYTVQAGQSQTTVMTPANTIYINGRHVFGPGPAMYAQYRAQYPQAPQVVGPGWPVLVENLPPSAGISSEQVLELIDNSLVTGRVTFESGQGKVLVHPGSVFQGTIEGGVLELLPGR